MQVTNGRAEVTAESAESAEAAAVSARQLRLVLGGLLVAMMLAALDGTIVATALPTIAGDLEGFSKITWVTTAYVVTSSIATVMLGKFSDQYGRRPVFLFTLYAFLGGSLLCGLAQTMDQLILVRALQGLGGGGITSLAFAIIGDLVSPRERGKYFGFFSGTFAFASVAGPLVGRPPEGNWANNSRSN